PTIIGHAGTPLLFFSLPTFMLPPPPCSTLLPYTTLFRSQIDVRGEQLGRRTKVDLGLVGDAKTTLRALLPKLSVHEDERHLKVAREHYAREQKALDELATPGSGPRSHPQYVAREIDQLAPPHPIPTFDTTTP